MSDRKGPMGTDQAYKPNVSLIPPKHMKKKAKSKKKK